MRGAWFVVVAGCHATPSPAPTAPPKPTPTPPPAAGTLLAVAGEREAKLVTAGATLVVTRTIALEHRATGLVWASAGPVVMLDDGEVGKLSAAHGFEPFPAVPPARWTIPAPQPGSNPLDPPIYELLVDGAGAVWQARCDWGDGRLRNDEISCDAWMYARVSGPLDVTRTAPSQPPPSPAEPDIAPSPAIRAELVAAGNERVLRCTTVADNTSIEFPAEDDRIDTGRWQFRGVADLVWMSTTPPMFRVTLRVAMMDMVQVFEGCDTSPNYAEGEVTVGPDDVVALLGKNSSRVTIRRRGRELGALPSIAFVAFAPR